MMEIRKLQYSGKGTFVLSLPKKWLEKYGIEKGDKFGIVEMENGLYITPSFNETHDRTATIDVTDYVSKELIARYTYGYNHVIVKGPISSAERTVIKDTIGELLGYDIIEESEDKIVITDLLNPAQLNTFKTLRREFFLASLMHTDAVRAMVDHDMELARDVIRRDSEVNKLYFFTVRQLRTALQDTKVADSIGVNSLESMDIRVVSKAIEEIGDHAAAIAKVVLQLAPLDDDALIARIQEFSTLAEEITKNALRAFLETDKECGGCVLRKKDEFYAIKDRLDEQVLSSPHAIHLRNVLENIKGIGEKGIEVAQLAYKP
jgi:phosphate uptake regulator